MITISSLKDLPRISQPIALTIGTFDGVHLGHQHLFKELKNHGVAVALTFSNHPSEVLHSEQVEPICSLADKLNLFETHGIDLTILLPFTAELSQTPYDTFLKQIHQHLPFSTLILGEGAVLGQAAQGKEEQVKALAVEMNVNAIYLPKFLHNGEIVSSRKIRDHLKTGNTEEAQCLLGRNS